MISIQCYYLVSQKQRILFMKYNMPMFFNMIRQIWITDGNELLVSTGLKVCPKDSVVNIAHALREQASLPHTFYSL